MQYLEALFVALQLVAGQSLWKVAVKNHNFGLSKEFLLSKDFLAFCFSPQVLGGLFIYGFATFFYMYLLSKYQYSWIQSFVTSLTIILALLIAGFIFKEKISPVNIFGVGVIIVGIIFVSQR